MSRAATGSPGAQGPGSTGAAVAARPHGRERCADMETFPGSGSSRRRRRPGPAADRRVTIADVAADAGVGVGTVSRVLNGSEQVREATRRAVLDSIDRLGLPAQSRGGGPGPRHAAHRGAPRRPPDQAVDRGPGGQRAGGPGGAGLRHDRLQRRTARLERDRHLEALLPTHRADGVLAICLPLSREQLDQFARAGVALASVDAVNPGVPQTVIDDVAGGRLATGHLISLGHRRIGFVGDMPFSQPPAGLGFTSSAHRLRGYKQALAAAGIGVEPGLIRRGPHDAAIAAEHAAQLLKSPDPPSAIFAASDTQAIGVLAAAERLGVAVPGQLSVVGFDDIESAAFLGLSTRPAAAGPQRRRGSAAAVRAAARGEGPPAAAGTADRADGAAQFGPGSVSAHDRGWRS